MKLVGGLVVVRDMNSNAADFPLCYRHNPAVNVTLLFSIHYSINSIQYSGHFTLGRYSY